MNGREGDWLEEWVEQFLASTPPGWPFEDPARWWSVEKLGPPAEEVGPAA